MCIKEIKGYFNFNRAERNGLLVLSILIILFFIVSATIHYFIKPRISGTQFSPFEIKILDSIESAKPGQLKQFRQRSEQQTIDFERVDQSIAAIRLHPFPFNPNNLPEEQWVKLGLTPGQIRVIKNYESKGGKFKSKEDVKKMYSISSSEYDVLAPFIQIPEEKKEASLSRQIEYSENRPVNKSYDRRLVINLNQADSSVLVSLRGIGPVFARRILRYRDILGGFCRKEQLLEVYGLEQVRYDEIADLCTADESTVRKININTATVNELKRHPYLDYYLAKAIVDRRVAKGDYTSVEQIREIQLFTNEIYLKIKPYLSIQ
jgi:competence protein ComEA